MAPRKEDAPRHYQRFMDTPIWEIGRSLGDDVSHCCTIRAKNWEWTQVHDTRRLIVICVIMVAYGGLHIHSSLEGVLQSGGSYGLFLRI